MLLLHSPPVGTWKSLTYLKLVTAFTHPSSKKKRKDKERKKIKDIVCLIVTRGGRKTIVQRWENVQPDAGWALGFLRVLGLFGERCVCEVLAGEGIWLPNALLQVWGGYKPN